jgi:hypothetical protein
MRFLGGKWQKKNNGDGKRNRMSRFVIRLLRSYLLLSEAIFLR